MNHDELENVSGGLMADINMIGKCSCVGSVDQEILCRHNLNLIASCTCEGENDNTNVMSKCQCGIYDKIE